MLGAGHRSHIVTFERRVPTGDDGYGNQLPDDWTPLMTTWAAFRPEFGRERLAAGRLESTLRGVLTVVSDPDTAAVTAADRVVFVSGPYAGKECQIRSAVPTPDAREIEFLVEHGVAT